MFSYYGVIHKDKNSDYGISFPDLPGCISAAETVEELNIMAKEALQLHITDMAKDGEKLPTPSKYTKIVKEYADDTSFQGAILVVVNPKPKRTRINISLAETDLFLIDTAASKLGLDRSSFLVMAGKKAALHEKI